EAADHTAHGIESVGRPEAAGECAPLEGPRGLDRPDRELERAQHVAGRDRMAGTHAGQMNDELCIGALAPELQSDPDGTADALRLRLHGERVLMSAGARWHVAIDARCGDARALPFVDQALHPTIGAEASRASLGRKTKLVAFGAVASPVVAR